MNTPVCIIVELCTSHVGINANPRHYQDHYQDFIQCLSNIPLPIDVTLVHNVATVELLEWLREKKQLKAMKGGKTLWGPSNLEQERHREGEFPRIGAFEVFILSSVQTDKGAQTIVHEAFSKLHHNRWPTVPLLVQKLTKTLARIKKRDAGLPRCSAVFLSALGKLYDCHQHSPGTQSGDLYIPSLAVHVEPEVEGELLPDSAGPQGAKMLQLCDVTPGMRVRAVNLRNCEMRYSGAKEVAAYVQKCSTLHSLCLRDNGIDAQGAKEFAKALAVNSAVTSVDLRGNVIGPMGATALAEMLKDNKSIKQLNLYGNQMGEEGGAAIAHSLKRNHSLTCLDLGDNQMGDQTSTKIANSLRGTTTLTSLQISPLNDLHAGSSGMGDSRLASGYVALVEALRENANVHTLNIGASSILSQWDPMQGMFPHKMMTPSLWKGRESCPASVFSSPQLNCTRTELLRRPNHARQAVVAEKKEEEEQPKKVVLAGEYTLRRTQAYRNGGSGRMFDEIARAHQISLQSLQDKGAARTKSLALSLTSNPGW
uniref:Uncharacterized protein n=1 Tax=Hemiselmis andersenii TaxID=464988 RepID=A0A6T8IZZ7_HEMAN|mmetsp:Transcript_15521/g.35755  ORF Transcript_15521/g.35755 Transcript_15521/m.35755 type:complete len:539 (-) Transcript_15521:85-1701(-)